MMSQAFKRITNLMYRYQQQSIPKNPQRLFITKTKMINYLKKILLLLPLILFHFRLLGCSCDVTPTFMEDIDKNTLIIHAKVIGHVELPVEEIRKLKTNVKEKNGVPPPLYPFEYHSYTILEKVKMLYGKIETDTLLFLNGAGSSCLASIHKLNLGEELIIKADHNSGNILSKGEIAEIKKIGTYPMLSITIPKVSTGICKQWYLSIQEEQVIGNITKNEKQQYIKLLNSKTDWKEAEKEALYAKIKVAKVEKMSYAELLKLLKFKTVQLRKKTQY